MCFLKIGKFEYGAVINGLSPIELHSKNVLVFNCQEIGGYV